MELRRWLDVVAVVNAVVVIWLGLRRGAFTCVTWHCDVI